VQLPAGNFSEWLRAMRRALGDGPGMDVACGDCVGCCTSSYFIKIRPHETRALAAIGKENLEPAPGPGNPNLLMGYLPNGHCPMFGNGGCTIYQDRPDTCRTYDCRVFSATAMKAGGDDKSVINERVASWRFEYPTPQDHEEQRAVIAAANFIRQHPIRFPGGRVPARPSEVAVLAVKAYSVFLQRPETDAEVAAAIIAASREFDRNAKAPAG
jgi:Fe-S-cluster containining protein